MQIVKFIILLQILNVGKEGENAEIVPVCLLSSALVRLFFLVNSQVFSI